MSELIAACDNSEAHTRIVRRLEAMTKPRCPLPLADCFLKAVHEPHLLVRLRAASLLGCRFADAGCRPTKFVK